MKRILFSALLTFLFSAVLGQKIKTVEAEYTYFPPENVAIEKAREIAVQRAKIQAIADEFGIVVSQHNTTHISNQNGHSNIDFSSFADSDVKGEWIETIGEPEIKISYEGEMLVVKARVKGKAREIVSAAIDLKIKILRNGTEDKFESENFREGDDLYLSFQSPVDGYLTVYLVDNDNQAFCLLPYGKSADGAVKIRQGRRYLFFSSKDAPQNENSLVDEYVMTTEKSAEFNNIYIIFSQNAFIKAADNLTATTLPRQLAFDDFNAWLVKNRRTDKDMQLVIKTIEIRK